LVCGFILLTFKLVFKTIPGKQALKLRFNLYTFLIKEVLMVVLENLILKIGVNRFHSHYSAFELLTFGMLAIYVNKWFQFVQNLTIN